MKSIIYINRNIPSVILPLVFGGQLLLSLSPVGAQGEIDISNKQSTTVTTTTTTPPVVLDSYMKPVYSQVREQKTPDGGSEKVVEPMIMERHEHVALPQVDTTTTTVMPVQTETQTTELKTKLSKAPVVAKARRHYHKYVASHRPTHPTHHRVIARHAPPKKAAVTESVLTEKKTVKVQPVVIEQNTIQKPEVIERRDPALDLHQ